MASPDEDASEDEPLDEPLEASLEEPPDDPPEELLAALVLDEPPRSFFAQPDPLKWIAGDENCLRIVPSRPHDGQNFGPAALIPWTMSARWSQEVQRYS